MTTHTIIGKLSGKKITIPNVPLIPVFIRVRPRPFAFPRQ